MRLEPFEQRARDMERDREELPLGQALKQRAVHVPHVLLEHVVEVPHGLVEVDAEYEAERVHLRFAFPLRSLPLPLPLPVGEAEPPGNGGELGRPLGRGRRPDPVERGLGIERDVAAVALRAVG